MATNPTGESRVPLVQRARDILMNPKTVVAVVINLVIAAITARILFAMMAGPTMTVPVGLPG